MRHLKGNHMIVEKTSLLRKTLSIALALALGVLPGAPALAGNVVAPRVTNVVVPSGVTGVAGVGVMSRVSMPSLSLVSGVTPTALNASLAPALSPAQAAQMTSPAASLDLSRAVMTGAPYATDLEARQAVAAPSVERHPVLGLINSLRARGIELPESVSAADAPSIQAIAEALPEGSAKTEMLALAASLGSRGGNIVADASSSGRIFDGARGVASQAVEAAATSGRWSWLTSPLKKLIGREGPAPEPAREPAKPQNPQEHKVSINDLRWAPAEKDLPASTKDMAVRDHRIVGQDEAIKALTFGLKMGITKDGRMDGRHYNMFVSGPVASGRETALRHLLAEIAPKMQTPGDLVAATNFDNPEKPVVLSLPAGKGVSFVKGVRGFVKQAQMMMPKALNDGQIGQAKKQVMAQIKANFDEGVAAIQAEAKAVAMPADYSLEFVVTHGEQGTSFGTRLLYKGKPVKEGQTPANLEAALAKLNEVAGGFNEKFMAHAEQNNAMMAQAGAQIAKLEAMGAAQVITQLAQALAGSLVGEDAKPTPEMAKLQEKIGAWQEQFNAKVTAVNVDGFGIAIIPGRGVAFTYEGEGLSKDKIAALIEKGAITNAQWATVQDRLKLEAKKLIEEMQAAMAGFQAEAEKLSEKNPKAMPQGVAEAVMYVQALANYAASHYQIFLGRQSGEDEEEGNPLASLLGGGRQAPIDASEHFRVSLLVNNAKTKGAPVVWESNPTFENLFGMADGNDRVRMMGLMPVKTEGVGGPSLKGGSFHRANGGFLVLNAMDVLREPGVWPALMRAVRNGDAEIAEGGLLGMMRGSGASYSVQTKVKVILLGSPYLRMMLEQHDEDFGVNFQSVTEFEPRVRVAEGTVGAYAQVLKNIIATSGGEILEFSRGAMSRVLEQMSRVAGDHSYLTASFGTMVSLARESSFFAREAGRDEVRREDVETALKAKQDREETYRRHLIEVYKQNVFVVETNNVKRVGQINGLAVMGSFGVPMRVTISVSRAGGAGGIVSVDRNAGSTGKSFNKALGVVEGFLEGLFAANTVFPAKLTVSYEQNYGGIDGDSATSTEIYGILSALSGVGIGQNFAVTGSADQFGNVQAIGGVNEKIEGYFELAKSRGLTGDQGIIIPKSNVRDLNLSPEVQQAVADGKFHIYAVDHVSQGLEILTGVAYSEIVAKAEARLKDMRLAPLREQIEAKKELGVKGN